MFLKDFDEEIYDEMFDELSRQQDILLDRLMDLKGSGFTPANDVECAMLDKLITSTHDNMERLAFIILRNTYESELTIRTEHNITCGILNYGEKNSKVIFHYIGNQSHSLDLKMYWKYLLNNKEE